MGGDEHDMKWMAMALAQAHLAFDMNEVPIGAVIVTENKCLSATHNLVEHYKDATAHAELLAIQQACKILGVKYLFDATLFVTVEPCMMCASALYWVKIKRVVYATSDTNVNSLAYACQRYHPKTMVESGLCKEEASNLMKEFFKKLR